MKNRTGLSFHLTVLFLVFVAAGGCQFGPEPTLEKLHLFGSEKPPRIPDRMMAIWTDTVLHQPQQPGVRGFGGRVYFYRGEKADPIEVDGGLVVYAFDSEDLSDNGTRPEKKYVFTADQFAEHMSYTDMGPSYSIWLPWDEVGGPNRQLSLIARFEGRNGGVVLSKPTVKLLPGVGKYTKPPERNASGPPPEVAQAVAQQPEPAAGSFGIARASHLQETRVQAGESSGRPRSSRRASMTIDLPPSFRRHLIGPSDTDEPRASATDSRPEAERPDGDRAEPPKTPQGAEQATDNNQSAAAAQTETTEDPGESSGGTKWSRHPPSRAATGRFDFQDRWQRHSFRTPATPEALSTETGDALNRPAGWLQPLQNTPR